MLNNNESSLKFRAFDVLENFCEPAALENFKKELTALEEATRKNMKDKPEADILKTINEQTDKASMKVVGREVKRAMEAADLHHKYFRPGSLNYQLDVAYRAVFTGAAVVGAAVLAVKIVGREATGKSKVGATDQTNLFDTASERPLRTRESKSA